MRNSYQLSVLLVGLGTLAACSWNPPEQPVANTATPLYAPAPIAGNTITVAPGDTIYGLARQHNMRVADLLSVNGIRNPTSLRPGQTLQLPVGATPTTIGETRYSPLASMASPEGTSAAVTSEELPPVVAPTAPATVTTNTAPPASAATAPLPAPNPVGKSSGARWYKSPQQIPEEFWRQAAGLPATPAPVEPVAAPTSPPASMPPVAAEMDTTPAATVAPAEAKPATYGVTPAAATAPATSAPKFAWPVKGAVTTSYDPKADGQKNDGINIAAPKGAPVNAAAGGTVVYAGSEMRGFGNMVLVRHQGGWITAYAHLDRMVVSKDSIVATGDMLGTVGSTGGVSSPQLHFQIRQGGTTYDPTSLLPAH